MRLLRYGNRTFETVRLYSPGAKIQDLRVWKGVSDQVSALVNEEVIITVPRKERGRLEVGLEYREPLIAPIQAGQKLGSLKIKLGDKVVRELPVVADRDVEEGGMFSRLVDSFRLRFDL